jgi:hypothetical protein
VWKHNLSTILMLDINACIASSCWRTLTTKATERCNLLLTRTNKIKRTTQSAYDMLNHYSICACSFEVLRANKHQCDLPRSTDYARRAHAASVIRDRTCSVGHIRSRMYYEHKQCIELPMGFFQNFGNSDVLLYRSRFLIMIL